MFFWVYDIARFYLDGWVRLVIEFFYDGVDCFNDVIVDPEGRIFAGCLAKSND